MDESDAPSGEPAAPAAPALELASDAPPPWVPGAIRSAASRLTWTLVLGFVGTLVAITLVTRLRSFIAILVMSAFLSFAIEPAVNALAARGLRRGAATGLIFALVVAVFVLLVVLIVPAVVSGFRQLIANAPVWLDKIQRLAAKLGIDFSTAHLSNEIKSNASKVASHALDLVGGVLGFGASLLGQIFRWATIGLFTFYAVAEGPQLRRAICRRLPPARQETVLFIWNESIQKTGGYFYSRLLLAAINGTGMYVLLRLLGVPFAAPLALFEGIVAEFIPTVGTYIAGVAPVAVALLESVGDGAGVLAYILVYQQVENYLLSPKLTAKTMSLHPAVAFGAAIVGGTLGGVLMAFLSLPAAGVIQAAVQAYGRHYDVVESDLTEEQSEPPTKPTHARWGRLRRSDGRAAESDVPGGSPSPDGT